MSDLTEPQQAALKSLPWMLTQDGHLSHLAPHAGVLRALERRGLAHLNRAAGRWERTATGDAELAWSTSPGSSNQPSPAAPRKGRS